MREPVIQLYNEDCLPAMRRMKDNEFDLAITDPPYNVGAADGSFGRSNAPRKDKYSQSPIRYDLKKYANADKTPGKEYFSELFRVSKNQIIWGMNYYPQFLYHSGAIVWDKERASSILSDAEIAFQSFNKLVKIFKFRWDGFVKTHGSFEKELKRTIHPNQKPVALYKWLLKNYAKPGDRILDTHLGSGSIAIACWDYGFDLVGYELDKDYFEAAVKRLEAHKKQKLMRF